MLRRLNEKSWKVLDGLDPAKVRLVLPISSTEQHATHMPVGTDDFINQVLVERLLENPAIKDDYWLLPALHYGCSSEHTDYPGTFSLSPATLTAVVEDLLACMAAHGWKRLVIFNSHGGNVGVLRGSAQTWHRRFGVAVYQVDLGSSLRLPPEELAFDFDKDAHAGEVETSVLLHAMPKVVDTEAMKTQPDMTDGLPKWTDGWLTRDVSPTGIIGMASAATAEKGRKMLDAGVAVVARALAEIAVE